MKEKLVSSLVGSGDRPVNARKPEVLQVTTLKAPVHKAAAVKLLGVVFELPKQACLGGPPQCLKSNANKNGLSDLEQDA